MSSELSSSMLYVHPPLAIIGYAVIFIFTFFLFRTKTSNRDLRVLASVAWALTFAGLITGMVWAQVAWGSYWSWDPKETLTLALFATTSGSTLLLFENKTESAKWLSSVACLFVVLTGLSSFILTGLHSFLH